MNEIKVGTSHEIEELVTMDKSAISLGSGLLEVYSTPSMIAFMEKASLECVQKYLLDDETTVGGMVNIKHLKPTSIGKKVVCKSEVTEVIDRKIDFEVNVYEGGALVGVGTHTRFIIKKAVFMKQLKL